MIMNDATLYVCWHRWPWWLFYWGDASSSDSKAECTSLKLWLVRYTNSHLLQEVHIDHDSSDDFSPQLLKVEKYLGAQKGIWGPCGKSWMAVTASGLGGFHFSTFEQFCQKQNSTIASETELLFELANLRLVFNFKFNEGCLSFKQNLSRKLKQISVSGRWWHL